MKNRATQREQTGKDRHFHF